MPKAEADGDEWCNEFPSPAFLSKWVERHNHSYKITPLPAPDPWKHEWRKSARWRQRKKDQRQIHSIWCSLVAVINGLDSGDAYASQTVSQGKFDDNKFIARAQQVALKELLKDATFFAQVRRGHALSGDRCLARRGQVATAELIKNGLMENGYVKMCKQIPMVPLLAKALDEPDSNKSVDMLLALDAEESQFYASESNLLDLVAKSSVIMQDLETQYAFVGGSHAEYIKYWHRTDLPDMMWQWQLADRAKSFAGFTAVKKKTEGAQRKLLMACPANYLMSDPKSRADEGMRGAAAITSMHACNQSVDVASLDESNAFSYVITPEWMWPYFSTPPLRAIEVWNVLPANVRAQCSADTLVSAQYQRLPMGFTHSVHILMNINMRQIGITLMSSAKLFTNAPMRETAELVIAACSDKQKATTDNLHELSDESWYALHSIQIAALKEAASQRDAALKNFVQQLRAARNASFRIVVVCLAFAGARRKHDIHDWVEQLSKCLGLAVLVFSFDLGADGIWDFADSMVFHCLLSLTEQGFIDIWLGGPPCSTVSAARFLALPGGPRPVRSRLHFWGLRDLSCYEAARVAVANQLYVNFMALCEAVSLRGGGHAIEHPLDRGAPFPSLWATVEMEAMEDRTGAVRALHHQCPWGAPRPKGTCVSGTLDGLEAMHNVWCPGESEGHQHHGVSWGRNEQGHFHTRRLQSYTAGYAKVLAECIIKTVQRLLEEGTGPSGHLRNKERVIRTFQYGFRHGGEEINSVSILNEDVAACRHVLIDHYQSAAYLHVDDVICVSSSQAGAVHANLLMETISDSLESIGFTVPGKSRTKSEDLQKAIGYSFWKPLNRFTVAEQKWGLLHDAFKEQARACIVSAEVLRALIGYWLFAALLRREALSIPYHVFLFIEKFEGQSVPPSKEVRGELLGMAAIVPLLFYDISLPFAATAFATDAMGSSDIDQGGFGIVARTIDTTLIRDALEAGGAPGFTIARLTGDMSGSKFPDRNLKATKPFSLLNSAWFKQSEWTDVAKGRWLFEDAVVLGESRAVNKLCGILSSLPQGRGHWIISLQDNKPVCGSSSKGRSSSFPLNRVLRKRAALMFAAALKVFMPWVESAKQPADSLSRDFC